MRRMLNIKMKRNAEIPTHGLVVLKFEQNYHPHINDKSEIVIPMNYCTSTKFDRKRLALASALEAAARELRKDVG